MHHHSRLQPVLHFIPVFLLRKFRFELVQLRLGCPNNVERLALP
jgi:hypothetical protein